MVIAGTTAFIPTEGSNNVLAIDAVTGKFHSRRDLSRPGGNPRIGDAGRGKDVHDIVALRWTDRPDGLLALGCDGYVFIVATPATPADGTDGPETAKETGLARQFNEAVDDFRLSIWYRGSEREEHYHVALNVPVSTPEEGSPFGGFRHRKDDEVHWTARIDKDQAAKIIGYLLADGFFDRARNVHGHRMEPVRFPAVVLQASGPDKVRLLEEMSPGDATLKRVEGLRAVLDGDAAKAMDKLWGQLKGQSFRLIWRETSAVPIEKVETPKGFTISPAKAVRPIMARSSRAPWAEFYLFVSAANYYFGNTSKGTEFSAPWPGHWIIDGRTGETTRSEKKDGTRSAPRIAKSQAVDIARKRLDGEPFANTIDSTRMSVQYCPRYGRREAPFACWFVDFAKKGTGEVGAPGHWAEGYQVVIDPETGKIKGASQYER
jgi:hypothetical protein